MSETPMPRLDLDQALHWIRGHLSDPESPKPDMQVGLEALGRAEPGPGR